MKIENDIVIFGPEDVSQLSPGLQKVLAAYVGERLPPEQALSEAVNRVLVSATAAISNQRLESLQNLAEALVLADDSKRADAEAAIKVIEGALGVVEIVKPPPEPEPVVEPSPIVAEASEQPVVEEAPSLFGKIINLFKR